MFNVSQLEYVFQAKNFIRLSNNLKQSNITSI